MVDARGILSIVRYRTNLSTSPPALESPVKPMIPLTTFAIVTALAPGIAAQAALPAHVAEASLTITLNGPIERVMPMFGPFEETKWAPEFKPIPAIPEDQGKQRAGLVFTTEVGTRTAVWVMTDYDMAAALVRYVLVIPGVRTSEYIIRGSRVGEGKTRVVVTQRVTPLSPIGVSFIAQFEEHFASQAPHWEAAMNALLR